MLLFIRSFIATLLLTTAPEVKSQTINTGSFHKVIISPFIEATFIAGDREQVVINHCTVGQEKLHVETNNGTLRIYLEGAREVPNGPRTKRNNAGTEYARSSVTATIYYKQLHALSLRGEEHFSVQGALSGDKLMLTLYGEPSITFAEVHLDELRTKIYGDASLEINSGMINRQFHTSYGEGRINTSAVSGDQARISSYGDAEFHLNVAERIKISSFGDAKLRYKGNPEIVKGIQLGDANVARMN